MAILSSFKTSPNAKETRPACAPVGEGGGVVVCGGAGGGMGWYVVVRVVGVAEKGP